MVPMPDEATEIMEILDEHLAVRDKEGNTRLQGALLATVYFEEPWRREAREAVVACCEDYFRRCGERLRWGMNPDTEQPEPFADGGGSTPRAWLLARGENEPFWICCHDAEDGWGAGALSVDALGMERRPYLQLGYFRVSFPLVWFARTPGSLPEVLLEISRKLRPVSGYGGIGVVQSPDSSTESEYSPVVYQWAQRLPGLEFDYASHAIWLRKGRQGRPGIKGVNWLTVIGDAFIDEMGGRDKLEADLAALDSRFVVHRYDGGVMIQAGPRPQLGDAQRDVWPELYIKLSKYLRPIRITEHRPFQMGGPGERFTKERSEAWLRRFDDR